MKRSHSSTLHRSILATALLALSAVPVSIAVHKAGAPAKANEPAIAIAAAPHAPAAANIPAATQVASSSLSGDEAPPPARSSAAMHPVFRALHVSDMQREQIQNIGRNQAARLNDLYRTLASAKTALAALTRNGQFHDTQAKPHTDRLGAAMAEIALVRARSESEVIALLTPQQRQRLDQLRRQGTLDPATSIE